MPPIEAPTAPIEESGAVLPLLGVAALLVAASNVMNTYNGWTGSVYFGEEMVNPHRNVARSLFGGILVVMLLYLAVNAALLQCSRPPR